MPTADKLAYDRLPYPKVIVVGGGFAGLQVVKGLANTPYKVMLLDRQNHHCFQPLLYQVATASLSADSIAHPFRRTVGPMPNVAFRMANVLAIHPKEKQVETDHGLLDYDILVLATGTRTNFFGLHSCEEEAMQLKTISQALDIRSDFLQEFETAIYLLDEKEQRHFLNFVIVGGGPTGVELAGALAEIRKSVLKQEYREVESSHMHIALIDGNDHVLGAFFPKSSANALKYLKQLGVDVRLGRRATGFADGELLLDNGDRISTNTVIWAAGVTGASIPGLEEGMDARAGRYKVDAFNRVEGHPEVYAIGDIALMTGDPAYPHGHPQLAQVAVQQGRRLVKNLKRLAKGEEAEPFAYHHKGSMAVIGRYRAVVDIGTYSFGGFFAWLLWMFVHVMQLVDFRNRIMVLLNWGWKYLSWRNTIRLIIRPYMRKPTMKAAMEEAR
ncbi:MAG: NAD(P)/FAD-dependent oxidoreductase [Flavobacteriales bacterium]|nr:NAD(P)/FAD-dependent oxidoreductase [Flavobacteriales bacterium]MCB9168367.1 NAD(P)/FAD-dependent oxidoreductase [Flavobacteriales bacterium]